MNGPRGSGPGRDALLAAGAAVALYLAAGAAGFAFVNYDDPAVVQGNPVQSWATLGRAFTERMAHAWLPLYALSLGLDNVLFGAERPGAYHVHSVLLHGLNAALVVLLAGRLGLERRAALLAGLLFAVHPAVSESVAWVSSRKDLLSFAFAAGAALVFLRAEEAPRRPGLHAAGALLLAAGMLSKGTVVVLPALLVLAVLARTGAGAARRDALGGTIPYFAVAAGLAMVHMAVAGIEGTSSADLGPADTGGARVAAGLWAFGRYLPFLVFPAPLSVEHGIEPGRVDLLPALTGGLLLLAALLGVAGRLRHGKAGQGLALAGVLVALAPFNGVFPRTSVLFAERYLYLPASIACGILGWFLVQWPLRTGTERLVTLSPVVIYGVLAAVHLPVWKDSPSLWRNAVMRAGDSHLARAKLGEALAERALAEPDAAKRKDLFERAATEHGRAAELARTPLEELRARGDLGVVLLGAGKPEEALAALERARALRFGPAFDRVPPEFAAGLELNRAKALESCGREGESIRALTDLVRADPTAAAAWLNLGVLRTRGGDLRCAREALLRATKAAPDLVAARLALADLEARAGDLETALKIAVKTAETAPRDPDALSQAGEIAFLLGQPKRAEEWFRRALLRDARHVRAGKGLAGTLAFRSRQALGEGKGREAVLLAKQATETDPDGMEAWFSLGDALRASGDGTGALDAYREAGRKGDARRAANARASIYAARALAARAKGEAEGARSLLEKALAEGPSEIRSGGRRAPLREGLDRVPPPPAGGDGRAALLDGMLAFLAGEAAASVAAYDAAAGEGGPADLRAAALVLRSAARLGSDDLDGAVSDLDTLSAVAPEDARARFLLGHALTLRAARRRADGRKEAAAADSLRGAAALEEARRRDPGLVEASLALAEQHFVEGRSVDALRELNGVLARDPDRVEAHLVLGNIMKAQFAETGDRTFLEEAEERFRRALAVDPNEARALAGLGEMEAFANRPKEALAYALRALAADPDLPQARSLGALLFLRVGRAHLEKGDTEAALEAVRRADDLGGETAALCLLRADVLRKRNDWQRAGIEIERARTLSPGDPDVRDAVAGHYRDMGYAFLLHKRRDQAEEAFRRALAADGPRTDLSEVRRILERKEDPAEAPPPLSPAVAEALEKAFAEAARLHGEGSTAWKEGRAEEAEAKFRESLRSFETAPARFALGVVLNSKGDRDGAEKEYRQAVVDDPTLAEAWLNLGALLYRRGADAGAEEAYGAYLKHAPKEGAEETVAKVEALLDVLRVRREKR